MSKKKKDITEEQEKEEKKPISPAIDVSSAINGAENLSKVYSRNRGQEVISRGPSLAGAESIAYQQNAARQDAMRNFKPRYMTPEEIEADEANERIMRKDAEFQSQYTPGVITVPQGTAPLHEEQPSATPAGATAGKTAGEDSEEYRWWNNMFKEDEAALKAKQREQADADRLNRSKQTIAHAADAIASIANLWGTHAGGVNQKQTYATPSVYANYIKEKQVRDANIDKLRASMQKAYLGAENARNRKITNDLAAQRIANQKAREDRLTKVMESNEKYRNARIEYNWAALEEKARQFDASFDQKSEIEQNKILLHYAEIYAREKIAELNNSAKKDGDDKKAATEAAKERTKKVKELASSLNWPRVKKSIYKHHFNTETPVASELTPEQKEIYNRINRATDESSKMILIEELAKANPSWATENGIGAAASSTTTTTPTPAGGDDNTPPSMRQGNSGGDDDTPPSMRKK